MLKLVAVVAVFAGVAWFATQAGEPPDSEMPASPTITKFVDRAPKRTTSTPARATADDPRSDGDPTGDVDAEADAFVAEFLRTSDEFTTADYQAKATRATVERAAIDAADSMCVIVPAYTPQISTRDEFDAILFRALGWIYDDELLWADADELATYVDLAAAWRCPNVAATLARLG